MTPAAISQYLTGKQGYRIVFEGEVKGSLNRLAQCLKAGEVGSGARYRPRLSGEERLSGIEAAPCQYGEERLPGEVEQRKR